MNIIHLVGNLDPNRSIGRRVLTITKGLVERGHRVYIYAPQSMIQSKKERQMFNNNAIVMSFPVLIRFRKFNFAPEILKEVTRVDADIIHAHGCRGFVTIVATFLKKLRGNIPLVLSPYGSLSSAHSCIGKIYKIQDIFILKIAFNSTDRFLANTIFEKNEILSFGVPEKKIDVVYREVDINLFKKKEKNIFGKDKVVLYVGRINDIKGLDFLIKAFSLCSVDSKLVIVGPCDDFQYLKKLKKLIKKLKLHQKVIFYGSVPYEKLPEFYSSAKLLVLPSRFENLGGVLLEAQACECPVVSSNVGGVSEVMINGTTGFLVNPNSVDELAAKISFFLSSDNQRKFFGKNGRAFVSRNFSVEDYISRIIKTYESLA